MSLSLGSQAPVSTAALWLYYTGSLDSIRTAGPSRGSDAAWSACYDPDRKPC
jgi:hypothetical protein